MCQRGWVPRVECPPSCVCVCMCVWVGASWAALLGAWSHSANGAAGTASESIRPHYGLHSAALLPSPLLSSAFLLPPLPHLLSSSLLSSSLLSHLLSCPFLLLLSSATLLLLLALCGVPLAALSPLAAAYITPLEREPATAGSSHTDWLGTRADSDARGNTVEEGGMDGCGAYKEAWWGCGVWGVLVWNGISY